MKFVPSRFPQAVPYFNWYSIGKEVCRWFDMVVISVPLYTKLFMILSQKAAIS
jgi:hypothetical protein